MKRTQIILTALLAATSLAFIGCGAKKKAGPSIQNIGSDTMVNLAQAWAEAYGKVETGVSIEVSGGGSGIGVAALLNGTCDITNSSRHLEVEEIEKAKAKYGAEPKEYKVGYDALAIYVHPSNPLNEISVEQLSDLYREGGPINKWSELGITLPSGQDEVVRVSRPNSSGTYHYFREAILGKKADYKKGSRDLSGSKDVVDLVGSTPSAIGFSGIGYKTDKVKVVKVAKKKGEASIEPTIETTLNKTYPISRPMFFYTPPNAPEHVTKYIQWVLGKDGQGMIKDKGYIPLEAK